MRRAIVVCPLVAALVACEPGHAVQAPIVGGTRELGEPAVVNVDRSGDWNQGCSGTLISPSVVLTAKHCVQEPGAEAPFPPSEIVVGVGDRVGPSLREHPVRYVETTPGSYSIDPLSGAFYGVDIAVVVLETPITDIEPIPIRRDRPDDMIGQAFTAVGFGARPDGGTGEKYTGTGFLEAIEAGILRTRPIVCPGDSGGPAIQELPERRVIGVASFGEVTTDTDCPSSRDGYNGLFDHLDLIDRASAIAGDCLGVDETCNSLDDDCDGMIDEGCVLLGESCTADDECAFAQLPSFLPPREDAVRCEDVGGASICTRPCDPTRPRTSCASIPHYAGGESTMVSGAYCRRTSGCEGRCAPGAPGDRIDGESCGADTECSSVACADPGDGERRCLPPCRGGAGSCPVGEACAAASGACGYCVDAAIVNARRQLGEPCENDAECAEGSSCAADPAGSYCTHACNADGECAPGFHCESGRCARGARAILGEPCAEQTDCALGSFCVEQSGRGWCSRFCDDGALHCPEGLECTTASASSVCAPAGAILGEPCADDSECLDGACEGGVCTRECDAEVACPIGFACDRDGEGRARCLPPAPAAGGCCSVASRPRGWSSALAAVLALLVVITRRRGRPRAERAYHPH